MGSDLIRGLLAVAAVAALAGGPAIVTSSLPRVTATGVLLDVAVGVGLLWALLHARSGWSATVAWYGSWRAWLLAAAWAILATFELVRTFSVQATGEVLPLSDLFLLLRPLRVLLADLWGPSLPLWLTALAAATAVVLWSTLR